MGYQKGRDELNIASERPWGGGHQAKPCHNVKIDFTPAATRDATVAYLPRRSDSGDIKWK